MSVDVESRFTNVPVREAMDVTTELLYTSAVKIPSNERTTFTELLEFVSIKALFLTESGYYRQADGVAMGSLVGPLLATVFMSQSDDEISSDSRFYFRFVHDTLRTMRKGRESYLLGFLNTMNPILRFTVEAEDFVPGISFLDINSSSSTGNIESSWYRTSIDTCFVLNHNSICPEFYKTGIVFGIVHRIFNSSSGRAPLFDEISTAQELLHANQYPKAVIQSSTNATLTRPMSPVKKVHDHPDTKNEGVYYSLKLSYWGMQSEIFAQNSKNVNGNINS